LSQAYRFVVSASIPLRGRLQLQISIHRLKTFLQCTDSSPRSDWCLLPSFTFWSLVDPSQPSCPAFWPITNASELFFSAFWHLSPAMGLCYIGFTLPSHHSFVLPCYGTSTPYRCFSLPLCGLARSGCGVTHIGVLEVESVRTYHV
jgi:hypothetical protein